MHLHGYLETFKQYLPWGRTLDLEKRGDLLAAAVKDFGDSPSPKLLETAKSFLVDVEKWKALCMQDRIGLAEANSPRLVWDCLLTAVSTGDDLDKLRSVMNLKGFGASTDEETGQRRAKKATAVLRFLDPHEWGVVDWRTVAMLGFYQKSGQDLRATLETARSCRSTELRDLYNLVNECATQGEVAKYRAMRCTEMPRAADVDMCLFGASLAVWPLPLRT